MTGEARTIRRPAASFKVRRRSLSPKRQAEFDEWIETWGLSIDGPLLDWSVVFGRAGDVVLDIGFGHGESTIEMAAAQPDIDVIGVEVHTPGAVTVLDAIEHRGLHQIRLVHGDALPFLDRVPAESLAGIRVYFPDPWTKRRNHHRRLIRPDILAALVDRVRVGGFLHLATDIADYAESMQSVCDAEPRLMGGVIERPEWRPLTRFEQRGLDAGRQPTDLHYTRVTSGVRPQM
ncbi:MAG TPA: tRNA (guanosine(46)-N7)-methyltransferase TrmB [Ilumatobacteraceae bacterium]|nr:tRNA (guanosine(46)-N7)-methyltransferase TrmB [Ilumatobacteraceae bacterium]